MKRLSSRLTPFIHNYGKNFILAYVSIQVIGLFLVIANSPYLGAIICGIGLMLSLVFHYGCVLHQYEQYIIHYDSDKLIATRNEQQVEIKLEDIQRLDNHRGTCTVYTSYHRISFTSALLPNHFFYFGFFYPAIEDFRELINKKRAAIAKLGIKTENTIIFTL